MSNNDSSQSHRHVDPQVIPRPHHNGTHQQQQMKLSNRNQTILTGVRLSSDPNVLIDFSEINALKKFSEPMEIVAYKNDEVIKTEIRHATDCNHHDIEMHMYDANLMNCSRNGQAMRPTTLNLSGPIVSFMIENIIFII